MSIRLRKGVLGASAAALLATFASANASAQGRGFEVSRFETAERGSNWFTADSLDFRGHGRFAAGTVAEYNRDALVARDLRLGTQRAIVSDQLTMNLGAAVVLFDRLRLGLNVPVAAYTAGESTSAGTEWFAAPRTTSFGDVRVSTDVRLFGEHGGKITGAIGASVHAPTGRQSGYVSDGTFRVTPRTQVAGKVGFFEWSAYVGYAIRPETMQVQNAGIGSEVVYGGAAGVRVLSGRLLVGPELFGGSPIGDPDFGARTNAVEAMLGGHASITDSVRFSLGAGKGLSTGIGTPTWRMTAGLEWAPGYEAAPRKPDAPKEPAPAPAPEPAVVAVAESPAPVVEPAPVAASDRDHDGIVDASDACPDDAGTAHADPQRNGCPIAIVRDARIVITEQIKFRTASAELDPASDPILDAIQKVFAKHPEIAHVSVEGHTDGRGNPKQNLALSKARAAAVAQWLAKHGVEGSRLESTGFGSSQPIMDNATEEGRRENRRVEFRIVEEQHASR